MGRRYPYVIALACGAALQAQSANPLTAAVMERFNRIRLDWEESADLMPEAKYGFRLTDPQRTFGEWVGHTASGNYSFCAVIKGEKTPDTSRLHGLKTKAELSKALKDSFDYCAAALEGMTDQKALVPAGPTNTAPVRGMINLVSSDNEHYGNIVGYLRASNLTPPSTTRAQKAQKKK